MIDLYYQGGPLFMGILTLNLLVLIAYCTFYAIKKQSLQTDKPLAYIKQIGLFALVIGVFGQLIGLFQAFEAIQAAGMVSPAMLAGGLKVSMITTLYGVLIYIISFVIWFALSAYRNRNTKAMVNSQS